MVKVCPKSGRNVDTGCPTFDVSEGVCGIDGNACEADEEEVYEDFEEEQEDY